MDHQGRERLRATFDEDAERYERARPGYPAAVFDDLAELAGVGPDCRVLEIGCGTGQATVPLAERGCTVVAVELGSSMAAVARRRLSEFRSVQIHVAPFESWPLPPEPFDVVLSATAFHWLDPRVRVVKSAQALRPGGALATIATHHVAGGSADFFIEVQTCYERWDRATPPGLRLLSAASIPRDDSDVTASGRFDPATFRRHEWEQVYSTSEYLDLLFTYSGHRALAGPARTGLLDDIAALIETRYGGRIAKRYMTELTVARQHG